jgi:hypothetical protein
MEAVMDKFKLGYVQLFISKEQAKTYINFGMNITTPWSKNKYGF